MSINIYVHIGEDSELALYSECWLNTVESLDAIISCVDNKSADVSFSTDESVIKFEYCCTFRLIRSQSVGFESY